MAIIYCIQNIINNKKYVGKTIGTITTRFKGHIRTALRGSGFYLHASMRTHGIDKFTISTLEECHEDVLNDRERHWINELRTHIDGYNLTEGGEGASSYRHTDESRDRMRDNHWSKSGSYSPKGKQLTSETKSAISEALRAYYTLHDSPALGRTVSVETKMKISEAKKGQVQSPEIIHLIAEKNRGKRRSDESKQRYAESKIGNRNPMFGRPAPNRKSVEQLSIDDVSIAIFPSIKNASEQTQIHASSIRACCRGSYKTAGGFTWRYVTS